MGRKEVKTGLNKGNRGKSREFSARLENLEFYNKTVCHPIFTSDICGDCRFQILSVCLFIRLSVHFKSSEYVAAPPLTIL